LKNYTWEQYFNLVEYILLLTFIVLILVTLMKLHNFTDYIRVSASGALIEGTPAVSNSYLIFWQITEHSTVYRIVHFSLRVSNTWACLTVINRLNRLIFVINVIIKVSLFDEAAVCQKLLGPCWAGQDKLLFSCRDRQKIFWPYSTDHFVRILKNWN